jgi:Fe-S cluster biogenesis protein NfuA/nitrite reductase/ring-hydroxylating ferredoxin subunit
MAHGHNLREAGSRVEGLLDELGSLPDARARDTAEEAVRLLVEVYGAALERIVATVTEDGAGELLARLAADELVGSLLILHGLHPASVEERVRQALDQVRPYLGSHAGDVELVGVGDDGVARLRLRGSCDGCPSSAVTVKLAIERAVEEAAPELAGIRVEGVTETEPRLLQIQPPGAAADRAPAGPGSGAPRGGDAAGDWATVPELAGLGPGELRAVEVAGVRVLVCRAGGSLYAYRDACAACGTGLVGGRLGGTRLACPACGQGYDVRLAGRCEDRPELHLDPLPLLADGGEVRIAVPAGARS